MGQKIEKLTFPQDIPSKFYIEVNCYLDMLAYTNLDHLDQYG